jgi:hypothetical protein
MGNDNREKTRDLIWSRTAIILFVFCLFLVVFIFIGKNEINKKPIFVINMNQEILEQSINKETFKFLAVLYLRRIHEYDYRDINNRLSDVAFFMCQTARNKYYSKIEKENQKIKNVKGVQNIIVHKNVESSKLKSVLGYRFIFSIEKISKILDGRPSIYREKYAITTNIRFKDGVVSVCVSDHQRLISEKTK